jgi:hypothetical protein
MMNKEQLKERISNLPLFEKREVQVKNYEGEGYTTQDKNYAICEVDGNTAYAFVGKGYFVTQFKDVFNPILDSIDEEVTGYMADYGGFALLKIFPEREDLKDGNSRFGLMAMNSVDLSSSIIVKFCVEHGNRSFTIPPNVAGLKKQHTGTAANVVKDYVSMIGSVKQAWSKIITEFPNYKVVRDIEREGASYDSVLELGTILDKMGVGTRLAKKISDDYDIIVADGKVYNLWDVVMKIMDETSKKEYTSEAHKQRHLDKISKAVFDYAIMLSL